MNTTELKNYIDEKQLDSVLLPLYGDKLDERRDRLSGLVGTFASLYGDAEPALFSVPGRSELSGNHTDHNCGRVISASIDLDIIAVAAPRDGGKIRIKSEGFPEDTVDLGAFTAPNPAKFGSSEALIAGVVAGFRRRNYAVGGFDAVTTSNVLKGSGLSSSAAFEVMIGNILNQLYNGGKIENTELAKIAQYAENEFFGKPCGLMDQTACAVGGIVAIDFEKADKPAIEKLDFDLTAAGYRLCIVDTGGSHADLTDEYASIPAEMKAVAAYFGKSCLRELNEKTVIAAIPQLRAKVGDRAILRSLHFFAENRRVKEQTDALHDGDLRRFFDCVVRSGLSSLGYLQNAYSVKAVKEQGVTLALCLCERFFPNCQGAWRLHGGGFAGTVLAFVPSTRCDEFCETLGAVFGKNACHVLRIRRDGAVRIL